jgi:hypothetical protein
MRHGGGVACGKDDSADIGAGATIHRAGGQSQGPHSLVGEPVRADDAGTGELPAKLLDIVQAGQLQVHDGYVSAMRGDCTPELLQVSRYIDYAKVVMQRMGQIFRAPTVALKDYDTQRFHRTLILVWVGAKLLVALRETNKMLQMPAGVGSLFFYFRAEAFSAVGS